MKLWAVCAAIAAMTLPLAAGAQITGDVRLPNSPYWDGATVASGEGGFWVDGQFRYQKWENSKDWMIGPLGAWSPSALPALEVGTRFYLLSFDPDEGDTETGFSDILMWGKYQILTDPLLVSAGLSFTLPTGSDKIVHPWASGEFNFELFGAARYYFSDIFALIGHIGIRINADADIEVNDHKTELDGNTQFELGAGVVWQAVQQLDLTGELNFATEPYEDTDNDVELTFGGQYFFTEAINANLGLGIGLDDGSPDFELILGALFLF
ncbi:MAG TPA: hypothetical protein PLI51_12050 [bacterium]|nr:hypothetical protein [bacterium]HPQ67451.1 hypothetical protein [bacterium]